MLQIRSPLTPLKKGGNKLKVPLFKGDERGISTNINGAKRVWIILLTTYSINLIGNNNFFSISSRMAGLTSQPLFKYSTSNLLAL